MKVGGVPRAIMLGALCNVVGGVVAGTAFVIGGNWPALLWVAISFMWCLTGVLAWRTVSTISENASAQITYIGPKLTDPLYLRDPKPPNDSA